MGDKVAARGGPSRRHSLCRRPACGAPAPPAPDARLRTPALATIAVVLGTAALKLLAMPRTVAVAAMCARCERTCWIAALLGG